MDLGGIFKNNFELHIDQEVDTYPIESPDFILMESMTVTEQGQVSSAKELTSIWNSQWECIIRYIKPRSLSHINGSEYPD